MNEETLNFAIFLTGHDEETIKQMYADYSLNVQLHKTQVINQCCHDNTEHQKLTCNVCLDCHEIIETDI